MKKQLITTIAFVLFATIIVFSCKKKDDTAPETTNTASSGTTGGGTTTGGSTSGGTTGGSPTSTLSPNTWSVFKGVAATTYTAYTNTSGVSGGQYAYSFIQSGSTGIAFTFYDTTPPATGTYSLMDSGFTLQQPNHAYMFMSGASGFYSKAVFNNTISVTNTSGTVTIVASNVSVLSVMNQTWTVSTNLQK